MIHLMSYPILLSYTNSIFNFSWNTVQSIMALATASFSLAFSSNFWTPFPQPVL